MKSKTDSSDLYKIPNKFALKTGIEYLNEIRLSEGEAQDSTMSELSDMT